MKQAKMIYQQKLEEDTNSRKEIWQTINRIKKKKRRVPPSHVRPCYYVIFGCHVHCPPVEM